MGDGATGKVWGHFTVGNLDINGKVIEKDEERFAQRMSDNKDASYLHSANLPTFERFPPMFMSASEFEVVLSDSTRIKREMDKYKEGAECVLFVTKDTAIPRRSNWYTRKPRGFSSNTKREQCERSF